MDGDGIEGTLKALTMYNIMCRFRSGLLVVGRGAHRDIVTSKNLRGEKNENYFKGG